SVYSNLIRAYDNAIVLREEIGSLTLSYIQLAVYGTVAFVHNETLAYQNTAVIKLISEEDVL
ncbi:MAG: hypothetical protein VZQ97_04965, partial [Candidatus Onthomonas sp.]|nr:hypothetical protein [Candidatus Onthomonas sp.]